MATYHLTSEELLLVYLTFLARDEEGHPEYFTDWYKNAGGHERLQELFNSLKEKKVILKSYNPSTYKPNDIEFNKNFLRSWLHNSSVLGKELFDTYPPFLNINGRMAPLKDISKRFASLDDFFSFYAKEIGYDPVKHREIMGLLTWAKENGHLNIGICGFVISHQWEALKELQNNPDLIPIATNMCIVDE